ncbi:ABC transporter substrate-binding protein [Cupriavidus metallidurans]|uniref:ABC transporter substrate-binding protein n=1 Tax=Cupriavidus TaxID=106589 RepID=UPI0002A1F7C9|nr:MULTISPECIES: ABC transporter substrate-binding protein [Cupriavidus]ELA01308.1 urea/short-chain amide ABC transporter [Cupriavidus sp. HMR-1]GMG92389.1 ABC transporter substrate-binding protein [Cupriavidus sp. TKC]HBD35545.1 ABC transporter permease [Cupriavidus sp.]
MKRFPYAKVGLAAALAAISLQAGAQGAGARISDGVVKIGVLTDVNGPFMDNVGRGSIVATEIAIEEFGGKVLGYPVQMVSADHQNKADVGSARVREWFDRDKVDVVTELGNSAVALAAMKIAETKHRMSIVTGAGAVRISSEDCTPTNLQWVYDTYALAKVGTQSIVRKGAKNWYYLTADYAFGHSLENDGKQFIEAAGGKVLGSSRYPFPGSDFSSYILKAQASKANAVAIATAGLDLQNAIKQGREFGLVEGGQQAVAMLMSIVDVNSIGLKDAGGMMFAESFYWDLDEASRKFARKFFEKTKRMPTALQAGQYSATLNYLRAIEKAKSDDVSDVMKQLKTMPIQDAFAKNGKVREDGKMVHDMYLVQVKKPQESKAPWDYYTVLETVPGDKAFQPLSESKCPLVRK